jgi:hypothetical protein
MNNTPSTEKKRQYVKQKGKCGKRWINQEINSSMHTHTHDTKKYNKKRFGNIIIKKINIERKNKE